jgi:hypothetical protein
LRELRGEEKERDGWPIRGHSAAENAAPAVPDDGGSRFSLVPLLLAEEDLPSEARRALREGRRRDAAALLKDRYGLDCADAGELTDAAAC